MSGVPSVTGFGVPIFVIATSALLALATITVALAVFVVIPGTMLPAVAVTVSVMLVPDGVVEFTFNTSVKLAVPLTASVVALVQVMVPVPPTGGRVPQAHPAGGVMD